MGIALEIEILEMPEVVESQERWGDLHIADSAVAAVETVAV